MISKDLQTLAIEPAIAPGPIGPGHTMLILTEAERESLLGLVPPDVTGAAASARIKLRQAAPVRDAGWTRDDFSGLFRVFAGIFETDGRERGSCRWCERRRTRIDQYGLCERCVAPSRPASQKVRPTAAPRNMALLSGFALLLAVTSSSCATSPTGRKQLHLIPDDQVNQMGVASFEQLKQQKPPVQDPKLNQEVKCVVDAVDKAARASGAAHLPQQWEVEVFDDDTPNAFALPGGKIGVHKGIFKVAKTPGQLATVIGHEMSHVISNHGNERISTAMATETGLSLLQALLNPSDPQKQQTRQMLFGLLGAGAQVGILLPFSRADETEADRVGFDLMARAGFDPKEAIQLWKNMEAYGGQQPAQFLSDHPSHGNRIADLESRMAHAQSLHDSAVASGNVPSCRFEGVALSTRNEPVQVADGT